ncbi:MAG TPA: SRPBCC family protein [Acidimicrobiales bacterium]|nr:SRPBCC family protein [Acidimicrobiales bacterium]
MSTELSVPAEEAFRLLADPSSFQDLVAGARRVRRFDSRWPEKGTRIDHTVGIPPLIIRDHTEVTDARPPEHLVLDAHVWPLGRLTVEFTLEDNGPGRSRLIVREEPEAGPLGWPVLRAVTRLAIQLRNREICRRFRKLTERRRRAVGRTPGA